MHLLAQKTALNQNMTAEIEKYDRIINRVKLKIAEIKTAEIMECLYIFACSIVNKITRTYLAII